MTSRVGAVRLSVCALLGVAAIVLALPGTSPAATKFTRIGTIPGTGGPVEGVVRTPDGILHLIYPTSSSGAQGLTSTAITASGAIGAPVTALSTDWGATPPGLVVLPNGMLEGIFGAISPATFTPPNEATIWGITSSDGGATWSQPVDVRSGPTLEAQAYNAAITAQMSGTTPVVTLPQAGNLVIQQGLGLNSPAYLATNSTDDFATDVDSALDAGTGQVIASWISLASTGGPYLQAVAPSAGTPQLVPGKTRPETVITGRDKGPGVFAGYTTDGKHVRLIRYGGGTVAVGSPASVTPAAIGVATGIDGRVWVMWGSDNGKLAVTRSNMAVTKFEPVQVLTDHLLTLERLAGDGRLGPLDLLVDEIADTTPTLPTGVYHARVLPELSAAIDVKSVKNKKKLVTAHKLTITVTDAGDAVSGAKVTVKGHTAKTNVHGVAKITLPGASTAKVQLTATAPTYQALTKKLKL
jgi:hypothetical protein